MNPLLKSILVGMVSAAVFTFLYYRVEPLQKALGPKA